MNSKEREEKKNARIKKTRATMQDTREKSIEHLLLLQLTTRSTRHTTQHARCQLPLMLLIQDQNRPPPNPREKYMRETKVQGKIK